MKKADYFKIFFAVIILLGVVLRFYNFDNRWHLTPDESRDAAIGFEALTRHQIPLIGSFSSAGPFVFGPLFYWLISFSFILLPSTLAAPWLITVLFSTSLILIVGACGYFIGGKRLAIIAAIITATSPQLVIRSVSLTQHTYIAIFTSLLILSSLLFLKNKQTRFSFFMGISLGIAISFHYQALNLLIFFLIPLVTRRPRALFIMALGFLLPSLPLLIWDAGQNFANLRNIADYFLIGQYRIYVPSSWRIFLLSFLPNYSTYVVGGNLIIGTTVMVGTLLISLRETFKRNWLAIVFLILLIFNRYYHGERFEGYLLYLAPILILMSAMFFEQIAKINRTFFVAILGLVAFSNLYTVLPLISGGDSQVNRANNVIEVMKTKYPNKQILVYDDGLWFTGLSQALGYLTAFYKTGFSQTQPIGVCSGCFGSYPLITQTGPFSIVGLSNPLEARWHLVSGAGMYDDLIGWSQKNKLSSSFDPIKYTQERFSRNSR